VAVRRSSDTVFGLSEAPQLQRPRLVTFSTVVAGPKPDGPGHFLENLKNSEVGTLVPVVLETTRFVGGSTRDPPLALAPTPHFPGVGVFLEDLCVLFATAQNNRSRARPRDGPIPIAVGNRTALPVALRQRGPGGHGGRRRDDGRRPRLRRRVGLRRRAGGSVGL
jgi:hypothetical protein